MSITWGRRSLTKENIKHYGGVALVFLVLTLIMLWQISTNMTGTVLGGGGDPYVSLWNLWWVGYATYALHTSIYFTHLLFAPIGANLVTQTMAPLAGIIFYPLQAVSLAFELNVITVLSYVLAGLFMYMLALRFTQNRYASFLAGMVFAYSAMHVVQSYGHLEMTSIEFIPLFVMFFMDLMKQRRKRHALYTAIAFTLVVFIGGLQYGLMMVMLAVLLLVYELATERRNVLNMRFAALMMVMAVLIFALGSWGYFPMIQGIQQGVLGYVNAQGGTTYNEIYSADLLSFFLPSFTNGFFHDLSNAYYSIYAPDPGERATYIGYSVLLLVMIAVAADWKEHRHKLRGTRLWLAVVILFGLLALGPVIQVGGILTGIPSIYGIYHLLPIFNVIREPGRFDIVVTLGLAMLAAIGFDKAMKSQRIGRVIPDKNKLFAIFFAVLVVEYWAGPFPGAYANSVVSSAYIPPAYYQIGNLTGNYSMLLLPALENGTVQPELYPGLATYYQTAFRKPMLGGLTVRENYTQQASLAIIPLTQQAAYIESGGTSPGFPYPILENYSNLTIMLLSLYNVKYVNVIRHAYTLQGQEVLLGYLQSMFGKEQYQDANTTVFSTQEAFLKPTQNNIMAYIVDTWIPGIELCQNPQLCPPNFENTWWGGLERGMIVYVPQGRSNIVMSLTGYSFAGQQAVYVYENNEPAIILQLNTTPSNYTVKLQLTPGFNDIIFAGTNNSFQTSNPYENYGLKDIYFH